MLLCSAWPEVQASTKPDVPPFGLVAVWQCSQSLRVQQWPINSFSQKILFAAGPFGVRAGSVRGPFGVRLGSVRAPFGPISDQNFRSQKFKISKIFNLCGRRRRGGGPQAALPSPAARRAPAAAATAAQIENTLSTIYVNYWDLTLDSWVLHLACGVLLCQCD